MININKLSRFILLFISTLTYLFYFFTNYKLLFLIAISSLFLYGFLYCFMKFRERVVLFTFLISILFFMYGRIVAIDFMGYIPNELGYYGTSVSNISSVRYFFKFSYISIFFIITSFKYFSKKNRLEVNSKIISTKDENIRVIAKLSFFMLIFLKFLIDYERIGFVTDTNFFNQYLEYSSNYPILIVRLSDAFSVPLFIFLSLNPPKKEAIIPILLYLAQGTLMLFTGQRMDFILNILIIFIYFVLDDVRSSKLNLKKWINKYTIVISLFLAPALVALLNIVSYIRLETTFNSTNNLFTDFFYKQGVTLKTILFTFEKFEPFTDFKFYTIGTITEFLINNPITQAFSETIVYTGQSANKALNGFLFGHRISYAIDPNGYLNGSGYGSSYMAESYVDFGILGIIIVSILISFILNRLYKFIGKNLFISTFSFLMLRNILVIPRGETTSFITGSFTLSNLAIYLTIIFLAQLVNDLKSKEGKL